MTPLDESYQEVIDPVNFIKNFPDMEAFRVWLDKWTINDLKETLKTFEKHELFEYCTAIQATIDCKVDKMLEGLGFD